MPRTKNKRAARRHGLLAITLALGLASTSANASLITINLTDLISTGAGVNSMTVKTISDPLEVNVSVVVDVAQLLGLASGSAVTVDGLGWDVTIQTFSSGIASSTTDQAQLDFSRTASPQLLDMLNPAWQASDFGSTSPTGTNYSSGGVTNLASSWSLTDGFLTLLFYEGTLGFPGNPALNDVFRDADALWTGTLTLRTVEDAVVPAPATGLLLLTGLAGLVVRRRRSG